MSVTTTVAVAPSDTELVAAVREGDDTAFEELYRRYRRRIASFVHGYVRDEARAEDVTQEAFLSALRRMRATDAGIAFKPWIYEIARNAAIDVYRRASRAEELPIDGEGVLRPSDRRRLVASVAPEAVVVEKERLDHLQGALEELSETHHRVLVMRELEGLSYREIGEQLELTRPAVESALFRARRRLEHEYEEIDTGRRCAAMTGVIARLAEGLRSEGDLRRLGRHARRCSHCRRRARELGVEPLRRSRFARVAAVFPVPAFMRRSGQGGDSAAQAGTRAGEGALGGLLGPGAQIAASVAERAAAIATAAALAGAGGAALGGLAGLDRDPTAPPTASARPAAPPRTPAPAADFRSGPQRSEPPTGSDGASDTAASLKEAAKVPAQGPAVERGPQVRRLGSPEAAEPTGPSLPPLPAAPDIELQGSGDGSSGSGSESGSGGPTVPEAPPPPEVAVPYSAPSAPAPPPAEGSTSGGPGGDTAPARREGAGGARDSDGSSGNRAFTAR